LNSLSDINILRELLPTLGVLLLIVFSMRAILNKSIFTQKRKQIFIGFIILKLFLGVLSATYLNNKGADFYYYKTATENLAHEIKTDFGNSLIIFFSKKRDWDSANLERFSTRENNVTHGVKYISIIKFLLFGSFYATVILICFATCLMAWLFYYYLVNEFNDIGNYLFIPLFLFPSYLFWSSSGYLKESYILLFIYPTIMLMHELSKMKKSFINIVYIVLLFYCLYSILKIRDYTFYVLIISFLFSNIIYLLFRFRKNKLILVGTSILLILSVGFGFSSKKYKKFVEKTEYLRTTIEKKTINENGKLIKSKIRVQKNYKDLIYLPGHFVNATLRPWLWESVRGKTYIIKIESFFILSCIILFFLKIKNINYKRTFQSRLLLFLLIYSIGMMIIIGLISLNYGATHRYRAIYTPFLLTSLYILYCSQKISKISFGDGRKDFV